MSTGVSRQAYYKWRAQPQSQHERQDERLLEEIRRICRDDPEFGYRFIFDELHAQGLRVSERKVWRLCSQARIFSAVVRRTTKGNRAGLPVYDDLLQRHFHAMRVNMVWAVDITEHWIRTGKVYVCAFKDLCSRRIVGWAVSGRMTSQLAVDALDDAMRKRQYPRGVIIHSDRGGQFPLQMLPSSPERLWGSRVDGQGWSLWG